MPKFETPEGATPIDDADGLLVPATTMGELSAAEAKNILKAVTKHLTRRHNPGRQWLTEDYIRKVHRDMFEEVWDWAGNYRASELTIGIEHHRIREEISKLCADVSFWDSQKENPMPLLERTARLHHRLAWIHPFRNGNGRYARLIADIYLNSHEHPLPVWPSEEMARSSNPRDSYLAALREGDQDNFVPLMEYIQRYIERTNG